MNYPCVGWDETMPRYYNLTMHDYKFLLKHHDTAEICRGILRKKEDISRLEAFQHTYFMQRIFTAHVRAHGITPKLSVVR